MEPGLADSYTDLVGDVGFFLGYGRGELNNETSYSTDQWSTVRRVLKSGLRKFYYPELLDGSPISYEWSFLKPVATLTLPASSALLPLPDDFGTFDGSILLVDSTAISYPVPISGQVRQMIALQPTATGKPQMAEVEPIKEIGLAHGQRWQLRIWPTPDQAYTLQFKYSLSPDFLDGTQPYVYGGPPHAETVLEACLSVAESRLDDSASLHAMEFQKRLAASISIDRRNKPQQLGYNGDRSDRNFGRTPWWMDQNPVTYNGVEY